MQVGLVLLAYFLRFESDLAIFGAFCGFAGLVLGLLHWAAHSSWRLQGPDGMGAIRHHALAFMPTARLPALALGVMTTCLVVYAATVVASSTRVGIDVGVLCLAMLIVLVLLSTRKAGRQLQWFERAIAYISVVLIVYLDQTMPDRPAVLTTVSWTLIAITGVAALIRFSLSPTRRFEVTALDLLVIFIALVMPNLPGPIGLPEDLPAGIAKAVILLYVVEMLLTIDLKRLMPRVFLMLTLAVIAGRALLASGT
jgi:UDP-GlcNAc:undecaprenyl-phosphate GlcNAc-1-phosphate transferase